MRKRIRVGASRRARKGARKCPCCGGAPCACEKTCLCQELKGGPGEEEVDVESDCVGFVDDLRFSFLRHGGQGV